MTTNCFMDKKRFDRIYDMTYSKIALTLAVIFVCTFGGVLTAAAQQFYVGADGNDSNPGTKSQPFATIAKARDTIAKAKPAGDITVWVRGGSYNLSTTLAFGPRDSGTENAVITYAAYPGEEVTLKGSAVLKGKWKPYKNGIYVCSLSGTPIDGKSTNQLFCNNKRMVRARYPDWDFDDPLRSGKGYLKCSAGSVTEMTWRPGQLDNKKHKWSNPQTAIVHTFHSKNWGNMMYRIKDIDWDERRILFGEGGLQCQRRIGPGVARGDASPYYIENIFEELNAPGEWFIDSEKNLLYFYPPEGVDITDALIEVATIKEIIQFKGTVDDPVHHINLRGFHLTQSLATFMNEYEDLLRGDWSIHHGGAVFFSGARNCRIDDFHIEQVGGNGIFHSGYNRHIEISGCLIENIGDSAVCYVGSTQAVRHPWTWTIGGREGGEVTDRNVGPKTDDYPKDCAVRNSILRDVGVYGKQTSGVAISKSMNITISHCTVYRIPRAGITFNDGTWGGHILEHCDIWDTVMETGEHGPFNGWGRDRFWTGLKKDLVLLDAFNTVHIRNNRIANMRPALSAGNWTIDLDDGCSNYHIYNNLSLGSTLKLRDGFYRKVFNNIHVSAVPLGWHCWPAENEDTFERNITVIAGAVEGTSTPQHAMIKAAGAMSKHPWGLRHGDNLWWNVNTNEFVADSKNQDGVNSWTQWRKLGYGQGSVLGNPKFIDPLNGDYRVNTDSAALKLGFKNFPMDRFGHEMTRIQPFGGEFEKTMTVKIREDGRRGQIRYTLNGLEPTVNSPLYKKPIVLNKTTVVRAKTFKKGITLGFEARADFTKVEKPWRPSWLDSLMAGRFVVPKIIKTAGHGHPASTVAKSFKFAWLGAVLVNIDDADMIDALGGEESGAYVSDLKKNSHLDRSGLKKGDIIKKINSRGVKDAAVMKKTVNALAKKKVKEYTIDVFRNYEIIQINFKMK